MERKVGFTLIELLVVIGILTVLFAIVLIAVNPARQFSQANDTQRRSDVNAVLNGIHQYSADNRGALPSGIDTTTRTICTPTGGPTPCAVNAVNLCSALAPTYIANIPRDPLNGTVSPSGNGSCDSGTTAYNTVYTVASTGSGAGNRLTVCGTLEVPASSNFCVTR